MRRAALIAAAALACGSSGRDQPLGQYVLTIQANVFTPARLEVPPGATVVVLNRDPRLHTVTSEAVAGSFTYGEVGGVGFDTGPVAEHGAFGVPASAEPGTVVPFFDRQLGAAVEEGELVVVAP